MKQPLQQQDEEQDIEADGGSLPPTLSVVRSDSIIVEDKSPDVKAIIEKEPPNTNPTPIFFRADDGLLHRAVEDAGRWAYGTVFVELWAWNDSHTALFRPEAGWWVDPVYHRSTDCTTKQQQQQGDTTNNKTTRSIKNYNNNHCPICRLTDSTRSDFVPPVPVPAGVGLPGVLWTEGAGRSARRSWSGSHPRSSQQQRKSRHRSERNSQIVLPDSTTTPATSSTTSTPTAVASHPGAWNKRVVWREVKAIANDPDQPWNPRMQILATLGLGWVAAVDFEKLGHSGILVYMARDGVQMNRLQSISNENYLVAASDFAAAAYALRGPRRCVVNERRLELTCVLRRVKNRILLLKRMGVNLEQLVSNNNNAGAMPSQNNGGKQEKDLPIVMGFWKWTCSNRVQKKAAATLVKARGGGVQIPPPMGWQQAWLTFFGCFLTMLIVTTVNSLVSRRIGPRYAYPIPPFGALMTLLYGLSSAPASQPRNAILGQCLSLTIAIIIGYAEPLTEGLRQSLATAVVIGAMVKLGVTHPPAGAAAILFATGGFGWGSMLFMLIADVLAILTATIVNNMSDSRQYPSYWVSNRFQSWYLRFVPACLKEKSHPVD